MVVAKHDRAHEELSRQFQEREVEKEYTALIWGVLPPGRRIEEPIGRDPSNRQKMSTRARRARTAVSRITWAEHFPGLALVGVAIATGRTHQIRVHLSAIGHPIVGDALYGGVRRRVPPELRAVQKLERPFLHAARLAFSHPTDGRRLEFASELPEDLATVIEQLKHDIETVRGTRSGCRLQGSAGLRSLEPRTSPVLTADLSCPPARSTRAASSRSPSIACVCRTASSTTWSWCAIRDRWCCLPVPRPGELILVKQYRYAVGRDLWELPAGSLKEGEDPRRSGAARVPRGESGSCRSSSSSCRRCGRRPGSAPRRCSSTAAPIW